MLARGRGTSHRGLLSTPPPTIGYPDLRLAVGGAYIRNSSPFFKLYHRLYRVSQIDDSIRPTKPTATLPIFHFVA